MRFRPCIDIHNAKVKQIVGSSLSDLNTGKESVSENFVSNKTAADFAALYKKDALKGGHIIILNSKNSPYYESSKAEAVKALAAYPQGLHIGGGINADNAGEFIDLGASHVIVTSFVFKDGEINYDNLELLNKNIGKEHIVLDLSCRYKNGEYYIVSDRWQRFTNMTVNNENLSILAKHCDEFLIHAVDAEGKQSGIDERLIGVLAAYDGIPLTYAGGISSYDDINRLKGIGQSKIDFTVGSALDVFGGKLSYEKIADEYK